MIDEDRLRSVTVRRRLLAASGALPALAWIGALHAQAKPPVPIGWLDTSSPEGARITLAAFNEGMAALGWKLGEHYVLEQRVRGCSCRATAHAGAGTRGPEAGRRRGTPVCSGRGGGSRCADDTRRPALRRFAVDGPGAQHGAAGWPGHRGEQRRGAHRLPVVGMSPGTAARGGLLGFGADNLALGRAASYVDRILEGAKPGELPIEQPTTLELIINLKTAKALGITIAPSVRARATQVIE